MGKKKGRKGQATVPILVVAIALFLVLYLYLLPISEKCKLLPELKECKAQAEAEEGTARKEILVSESPGFIAPEEKYAIYNVKPAEIFNQEEIEIATILENVRVSREWLESIEKKGVFSIHEKSKEVRLFITISNAQGKLRVRLNPKTSFIVEGRGTKEIIIPSDMLDELNIVRLSVLTPLMPFQTDYYEIEKVVVKEVYSLTDIKAEREIKIEQNLTGLKESNLFFKAECLTKERLGISINDKMIKKETICGEALIGITEHIKENNMVVFSSDGNYLIGPIKIDLRFERKEYPTYYFNIEEYSAVEQGTVLGMLKLGFDSSEEKKLDIYINKKPLEIETNKLEYKTRINDYFIEGQNSIQLIPRTEVKIKSIEVYLE